MKVKVHKINKIFLFLPSEKSMSQLISAMPINNNIYTDMVIAIINIKTDKTNDFKIIFDVSRLNEKLITIIEKSSDVENELIINTHCIVDISNIHEDDISWSKCRETKTLKIKQIKGE